MFELNFEAGLLIIWMALYSFYHNLGSCVSISYMLLLMHG